MPKHIVTHKPQAPEFTDYTLAGVQDRSAAMRAAYKAEQDALTERRAHINVNRPTKLTNIRCGYQKMRERDPEAPSLRGNPFHKFTKRFKIVYKLLADGEFSAKVFILHYTKGWKAYA